MTWLLAIANLITLLAGLLAWWKQYQIRLEERERLQAANAVLLAERDTAVRKAQHLLDMDHAERQKLQDAEYHAAKNDPSALLEFLNRRL